MKIVVAGAGHIGVALAALFALCNDVTLVDVDPCKVDAINAGAAVSDEQELAELLGKSRFPLRATLDGRTAYAEADLVVVAVHTDFDDALGTLDTAQVDQVVGLAAEVNPSAVVAVKSTLPVGYTDELRGRFPAVRLLYCPEFLREGREAHDCLNPTRIVVGVPDALPLDDGRLADAPTKDELLDEARRLAALLIECSRVGAGDGVDAGEDADAPDGLSDIPVYVMSAAEAEAVKLFSNAHLAMRVAFFNELDGFCEARGLKADLVVRAVCADPRIGDYYNNPSFGYGGGCLPKDSRQLCESFGKVPHPLVDAIVESNEERQERIADIVKDRIMALCHAGVSEPVVGMYGLSMKSGVVDARLSSSLGVAERLRARGVRVIAYDSSLACAGCSEFSGFEVAQSLEQFKQDCALILANRMSEELADVAGKVYTRDLFGRD